MPERKGGDLDITGTDQRSAAAGGIYPLYAKSSGSVIQSVFYPPGTIIHQKDFTLNYFGIIAKGEHRVINEFQNGNVYMIEKNEPIDFVGEGDESWRGWERDLV